MRMRKRFLNVFITAVTIVSAVTAFILLQACNVTRKVETKSQFFHSGDTTVQIVTKTTESYDASKNQ